MTMQLDETLEQTAVAAGGVTVEPDEVTVVQKKVEHQHVAYGEQTPMSGGYQGIGATAMDPDLTQPLNLVGYKLGKNPLIAPAQPLLTLLVTLRESKQHRNVVVLHRRVVGQIQQFEAQCRSSDIAQEQWLAARYMLCAALDEAVLNTQWGARSGWAQRTLLSLFHHETNGGEKVFLILERLHQTAAKQIDLLELFYLCFVMGFMGKYRLLSQGREQLHGLQENLYRVILQHRGSSSEALSPHWKGIACPTQAPRKRISRWVAFGLIGLGVVSFVLGTALWMSHNETQLIEQIEHVQRSITAD